ncbi:MAG: DUF4062 domain-containing protein, partial [Deltaproteobacteria bacterium]|nr:DUF4062 domain-containing protein [Deltaproteobacteria bacterium]
EADATHNQRVVEVCLQNIDRCRPFFLCFLGQRYGWIPGLGDVSAETLAKYRGLSSAIAEQRSVTELEVLHAVLAPFAGGKAKLAADQSFFYLREADCLKDMSPEPVQLRRIYSDEAEEDAQSRAFLVERQKRLREAVAGQKQRPVRQYSARWSSDRRTPELSMPLDCPATLPENQARWRRDWQRSGEVSIPETALSVPAAQTEKARAYNQRLTTGRLGDFWSDGRSLTEAIVDDLKAAILERYPERRELPEQDDLSREIDRHEDFVRTAADVFIERPGDFAELDAYAAGDSQKLFALVAKAGLGKSTLLANWVARWRSREGKPADETVHARFVGVGERSNNVDSLVRSILEELRRTGKLSSEIPDNPNVLRSKLAELLSECGKKGRTVVVIDALNQLQSGLSDLDWLARTLPENVKLVVSFKLGDAAGDALAAQLRADERVTLSEVRPFAGLEERRQLVRQFLRQFLKELDEQHLEALIHADGADNPLFLKVVLTELRVFGAFGQLGEVIRREFGTTPQSAFEAVLRRLESDPSYAVVPSQQAVPLLFGLLAHSRGGLPEDLLARMFVAELGLGEERLLDMAATMQLFLRQVRPFLARREGRTDFFYEAFRIAARERYTASIPLSRGVGENGSSSPRPEAAWQRRLADACQKWETLAGPSERYALGNLVQHEAAAGNGTAAADALTDFGYHYARIENLGLRDSNEVCGDFEKIAGMDLPGELRERLLMWQRFYEGTVHLLRRPGILPEVGLAQEAYAHAEGGTISRGAEAWLRKSGLRHWWFRKLARRQDPIRSATRRVLEGHTGGVQSVLITADGRRAVSSCSNNSVDCTVRVWDIERGECLRTLRHHTPVSAVSIHPGGHRVAVAEGRMSAGVCVWDLDTGTRQSVLRLHGREDCFSSVAFHPDGHRVATASDDGIIRVWNLDSSECVHGVEAPDTHSPAVAFHPDRRRALIGLDSNAARVLDLDAGKWGRTLRGAVRAGAVMFHPDGHCVAAGSDNEAVIVWDLETGEPIKRLGSEAVRFARIWFHPDARRVVGLVNGKVLQVWSLETGGCLAELMGHGEAIDSILFHLDGKHAMGIVAPSPTMGRHQIYSALCVWDLASGNRLHLLEGHKGTVSSVLVHPDERRIVTGDVRGEVRIWDIDSGACLKTLEGHTAKVNVVVLLPDRERIVTGSEDTTLRVWDISDARGPAAGESDGPKSQANLSGGVFVAFQTDGGRIIVSRRRGLEAWSLETGECLLECPGKGRPGMLLHVDGRRGVLTSRWSGGAPSVLDLASGKCLQRLRDGENRVTLAELHRDGIRVVTASWDGTVRVWNLDTGECLKVMQDHHASRVGELVLHPDGMRAVTCSGDCTSRVWELETGKCLHTIFHHAPAWHVSLHADGERAVSVGKGGLAEVWEIGTGKRLQVLEGHRDDVFALAVHADRRRAVTGSRDRTVRVWDVDEGACLSTLRGHTQAVDSVAFLGDGPVVVTASKDKTIRVWDMDRGSCLGAWPGMEPYGGLLVDWPLANRCGRIAAFCDKGFVHLFEIVPPGTRLGVPDRGPSTSPRGLVWIKDQ